MKDFSMNKDDTELLEVALKHTSTRGIAIDGGANKGSWSLELSKHFEKVIAFEPHAGAFFNLARSTKGIDNIQIIEQALGHEVADVSLNVRRKVEFTDAYVNLKGEGTQMVPLDYYNLKNVGFIKLDLEGFEYFALLGMRKTIKLNNPVIIIESIPKFEKRFDLSPRKAVDFLETIGYRQVAKRVPNRVFIRSIK